MRSAPSIFAELMALIHQRKARRPAGSYTTQLFDGGLEPIAAKVLEEARELVEAARAEGDNAPQVVHEAADLLYHLLVLLAQCDVDLAQVEAELSRRRGTSGLEEKARRGRGD